MNESSKSKTPVAEYTARVQKWAEFLRDPGTKQCHGVLSRALFEDEGLELLGVTPPYSQEFCVLGAACEVYRQENPESGVSWKLDRGDMQFLVPGLNQTIPYEIQLPTVVRDWYGLRSSNGYWDRDKVRGRLDGGRGQAVYLKKYRSLTRLNDLETVSLPAMADFILSFPSGLFTWREEGS